MTVRIAVAAALPRGSRKILIRGVDQIRLPLRAAREDDLVKAVEALHHMGGPISSRVKTRSSGGSFRAGGNENALVGDDIQYAGARAEIDRIEEKAPPRCMKGRLKFGTSFHQPSQGQHRAVIPDRAQEGPGHAEKIAGDRVAGRHRPRSSLPENFFALCETGCYFRGTAD